MCVIGLRLVIGVALSTDGGGVLVGFGSGVVNCVAWLSFPTFVSRSALRFADAFQSNIAAIDTSDATSINATSSPLRTAEAEMTAMAATVAISATSKVAKETRLLKDILRRTHGSMRHSLF